MFKWQVIWTVLEVTKKSYECMHVHTHKHTHVRMQAHTVFKYKSDFNSLGIRNKLLNKIMKVPEKNMSVLSIANCGRTIREINAGIYSIGWN